MECSFLSYAIESVVGYHVICEIAAGVEPPCPLPACSPPPLPCSNFPLIPLGVFWEQRELPRQISVDFLNLMRLSKSQIAAADSTLSFAR